MNATEGLLNDVYSNIEGRCVSSWHLLQAFKEFKDKIEHYNDDNNYVFGQKYTKTVLDLLILASHLEKGLSAFYEMNETLYNTTMRGAYYKEGQNILQVFPRNIIIPLKYKIKTNDF